MAVAATPPTAEATAEVVVIAAQCPIPDQGRGTIVNPDLNHLNLNLVPIIPMLEL